MVECINELNLKKLFDVSLIFVFNISFIIYLFIIYYAIKSWWYSLTTSEALISYRRYDSIFVTFMCS